LEKRATEKDPLPCSCCQSFFCFKISIFDLPSCRTKTPLQGRDERRGRVREGTTRLGAGEPAQHFSNHAAATSPSDFPHPMSDNLNHPHSLDKRDRGMMETPFRYHDSSTVIRTCVRPPRSTCDTWWVA
jgi:hypothetical protein